jgi:hypothetical protein
MKHIPIILGATMTLLFAGCASTPVVLSPVGPNPAGRETTDLKGQLRVYSALEGRSEGDNPAWYQHTDYYIYSPQGRLIKRVNNRTGYYAKAPPLIALPAGKYLLKAQAEDYLWVEVPVVIESGRATQVHLDDSWSPPVNTPKAEIVNVPAGYPVGWRGDIEGKGRLHS